MAAHLTGPPHVEAYPKLDLLAAKKALARGRPVCAFFDELGLRRGGIVIRNADEENLKMFCVIEGGDEIGFLNRDFDLRIEHRTSSVDNDRWFVNCLSCGNNKQMLYFKHKWACRSCLKLIYRCQVVDRLSLLQEEREALQSWLAKGRPSGMHTRTYNAHLTRLGELKTALRGAAVRVPNVVHQRLCRPEWRTQVEDHEWLSDYGAWLIEDGVLVRKDWGWSEDGGVIPTDASVLM